MPKKSVTMTHANGHGAKIMRERFQTARLVNEILLGFITDYFGIGFLAIDVMALCYCALVQHKDAELAAEQLFVPINEFLLNNDKNSVCIVFDNPVRAPKKVASANRLRDTLLAQGLSEQEIKKKLAEMNDPAAVDKRKTLQKDTVDALRRKLGKKRASRVTVLIAKASGQPNCLFLVSFFRLNKAEQCSHRCCFCS